MNPLDFGPIYAETDMSRFPVEPWNTFSNLIFLFVFIYFARKTRFDARKQPLIVTSLPILLTGYVGGTLFHATRSSNLWLFLDFVPIFALTLLAAVHFWSLILGNLWRALIALPLPLLITAALRALPFVSHSLGISLGYFGLACGIMLPSAWFCARDGLRNCRWLFGSFAAFGVALTCRLLDKHSGLPMGTHFLWHIFGGVSTFALMNYIYLVDSGRSFAQNLE